MMIPNINLNLIAFNIKFLYIAYPLEDILLKIWTARDPKHSKTTITVQMQKERPQAQTKSGNDKVNALLEKIRSLEERIAELLAAW